MKISLASATKQLSKTIKAILIINLLSGCAGIPANKVRLSDYAEVSQENVRNLNLKYNYDETHAGLTKDAYDDYYEYLKKDPSATKYDNYLFSKYLGKNYELITASDKTSEIFNYAIVLKLKSKNPSIRKWRENDVNGCVVKIISSKDLGFCPVTNLISPVTLTILPYYCQHIYEARATLISHPKDSEISGTIKTSIANAKPGDVFLDKNNQPAKLLKSYELKDKVHEVWSLLWMLSWLVVEPNKYSSIQNKYLEVGRHPDVAKTETENTISEAVTRQVLSDASTFKECQKSPYSPNNKK